MHLVQTAAIAVVSVLVSGAATAHEFWLSPDVYQIERSEPVAVHLRVGENFKGASFSYFPTNFVRFELGSEGQLAPAEGRLGDRPALTFAPERDGLWLLVHETTDSQLTYNDWSKFERFVARHDLDDADALHRERGLPETGFVEAYRRFAKALIAVGPGTGTDWPVGLEVEIVAETNPFDADAETITVRLLENGAPRPGTMLDVFSRADDASEVTLTSLRADDDGRVDVPLASGTEVLLNFVVMRQVEGDVAKKQPVWRSLWASLTYAVP